MEEFDPVKEYLKIGEKSGELGKKFLTFCFKNIINVGQFKTVDDLPKYIRAVFDEGEILRKKWVELLVGKDRKRDLLDEDFTQVFEFMDKVEEILDNDYHADDPENKDESNKIENENDNVENKNESNVNDNVNKNEI